MPFSIIAAALLMTAGQTPAPPATTAPTVDPDKKVCKTIKETGSRLGGTRQCKTQAEWNRIAAENQQKVQNSSGR